MDEFRQKLEKVVKVAPDIAERTIRACGAELRRECIRQVDATGVNEYTGNLKKGMKFQMDTRTWGANASGKLRAETRKNPHLHLIENGHNVVPRGKTKHHHSDTKERQRSESTAGKGRTGYHMVENAKHIYEPKHSIYAQAAMERILKRAGLDK